MPSNEVRRIPIVQSRSSPSATSATSKSSTKSSTSGSGFSKPLIKRTSKMPPPFNDQDYLTTRKVEKKTMKNTEKRYQRRVVLPDGRILLKTDPEVVVDKVEDFETHEEKADMALDQDEKHQNHRIVPIRVGWEGSSSNRDVVDDSFKRTINTRDVQENLTKSAYTNNLCGIVKRRDLRKAIREQRPLSELIIRDLDNRQLVKSHNGKPKVLYTSKSHKKTIDTEDVHNVSRVMDNGKVYTETYKTHQHEVINDSEVPDDGVDDEESYRLSDREQFKHLKCENFTDYFQVPKGAKSLVEGRHVGRGAHVTQEEKEITKGRYDWDELSDRIRMQRKKLQQDRTDALTQKPVNFHQEEKTRLKETDKWLERHFGSDWSISNSSSGPGRTQYLLKRFESHTNDSRNNKKGLRRSMSFSSIPNSNNDYVTTTVTKTKEKRKVVKSQQNHSGSKSNHYQKYNQSDYPLVSSTIYKRHNGHNKQNVNGNNIEHEFTFVVRPDEERRRYHSTQCLLPPTQKDYSLHGSSINEEPVRPPRSKVRQHNKVHEDGEFGSSQHWVQRYHHHHHHHHHQDGYAPQYDQKYFRSHSSLGTRGGLKKKSDLRHEVLKRSRSSGYDEVAARYTEYRPSVHESADNEPRFYHLRERYEDWFVPDNDTYFHGRSQSAHGRNALATSQTAVTSHTKLKRSKSSGDHHKNRQNDKYLDNHDDTYHYHQSTDSATSSRARHHYQHQRQHQQRQTTSRNYEIQLRNQGHRSEDQSSSSAAVAAKRQHHIHFAPTKPRYVTEFRREKLYPATSENNLLYEFKYRHNYHGLKGHERSDAISNDDDLSEFDGHPIYSSDSSQQKEKRKERKRSQSFVHKPNYNPETGSAAEEEYVYNRLERKFVPNKLNFSFLKPGHSDLRLDHRPGDLRLGKHNDLRQGYTDLRLGLDESERDSELIHEQQEQRFKTIIFLS